jgi:hypothetical protein
MVLQFVGEYVAAFFNLNLIQILLKPYPNRIGFFVA